MPCKSLKTGEAEGACACSLEQERHPGGNIFPPVSGNQCTDSMNITVVFFAVKPLAHSWQKSVVKLPGLAWVGLGNTGSGKQVAQLVLALAWIFPFSSPWACASAPSPVPSSEIYEMYVNRVTWY